MQGTPRMTRGSHRHNTNQRAQALNMKKAQRPSFTKRLPSSKCVYQVGESGNFDVAYEVGAAPPSTLHVPASAPCGCGSNISYFAGADAILYCICDEGCCAPQPSYEVTPVPSTTTTWSFDWPGRQWMGPSDTNEPYGPPFPPGDYFATVTYTYDEGSITVKLPIHVVQ